MDDRSYRKEIVKGYMKMLQDYVDKKWDPYLMSFMFSQLPGKPQSIIDQMKRELEHAYGKLVIQFDRYPRSPNRNHLRPVLLLFPDLPVPKANKHSVLDLSINDGLHYHAIALTPPYSRFKSTLDAYFTEAGEHYINDRLEQIDVEPIKDNPQYVVDYIAKTFKRGLVAYDDIVMLPKHVTELSDK
jgi:hypothetical protein